MQAAKDIIHLFGDRPDNGLPFFRNNNFYFITSMQPKYFSDFFRDSYLPLCRKRSYSHIFLLTFLFSLPDGKENPFLCQVK
ncbi:hypothetical protein H206_05339 [Candidatus Electrothrix aarhusensis]|uniref:Uncharacterized protein n=1 Tax=Candidatus Electrothrix aarhusensis TaxID=1859131 RepID=A0A3S3QLX6_9BACT|nr:hypothetical protein H206_05339 [Candidatus Electrothrix aarhusensis]